jgi:hypothetical protein
MIDVITLFFCRYAQLAIVGVLLLFVRDDSSVLAHDLSRGFLKQNIIIFLVHLMLLFIIMPLSIPFSLKRIFQKWF